MFPELTPEPPGQRSPSLAEELAHAARRVASVLAGASLGAQPEAGEARRLSPAARELARCALRAHGRVDALAARLLHKPLQNRELYALVLVSLARLEEASASHTVVDQAVEAAALLGQARARGLVNAVLRNYLRRPAELDAAVAGNETGRYLHPVWWIERLKAAYPGRWAGILQQGNAAAPMTLRVNRRKTSVAEYGRRLADVGIASRPVGDWGLQLERPCPVSALPGFSRGEVSVQDAGAQLAASLLDVRDGMHVLDACSAPGGKAGHLLELADCKLTALELSPQRTRLVEESLQRLGFEARVVCGDAREAGQLFAGERFERILLDAPCSASGVVRRHPDIKWLRRPSDIGRFAIAQAELLEALWRVLAPDGKLLYATCSVFPEENGEQVRAFLGRHPDARRLPLSAVGDGQILPDAAHDGFYYALLARCA